MLASGGGVIINMASVAGLGATSKLAAYVQCVPLGRIGDNG